MQGDPVQLLTPGRIAHHLGVPVRQVRSVLDNCPNIRPAARAGVVRVYDQEGLDLVREELEKKLGEVST